MDRKRIQQVREVAREAFDAAGASIDDAALDFVLEMIQDARFQQLANHQEEIAVVAVMAGFLQEVTEKPDMSEEEWHALLEKIKQIPYGLRPAFRKGMDTVVKGLPKRPSSGRNEILDSPQKREKVCDLVSIYERSGDSKRVAYEKVARKMNCSPRTIQRAWKGRDTRPSTARN